MKIKVGVKKLNSKARIPTYADPGSSGFDFHSTHDLIIPVGGFGIISSGLAFEIPPEFEIQVRGRSGLAFKEQIVAAHFGTIDDSYKGEVKVILFNLSNKPYRINTGDKIAQGVLAEVPKAVFEEVDELSKSLRGDNGFGSTGK